jgi:cation:H+ antiporter
MFASIDLIIFSLVTLVAGLILLSYSSNKAVDHSVAIASALGVSPLIIGLVLVSIGTDLPEVFNSILASQMGHGDINVGDSLGSILAQITLVFGLLPFVVGNFKVKKKEVLIVGACELLSLIFVMAIVEKSYITRLNGFLLILSWFLFTFIIRGFSKRNTWKKKENLKKSNSKYFRHFLWAIVGFAGIAVGAYLVIQSVVTLSGIFSISELIVSFFAVAIGTSLPEIFVNITALRKNESALTVGNTLGSCIFDACFSIGIGPLLFPISLSGDLALITGGYALFASVIVILLLAFREKLDRKSGALFLLIYMLSYSMLNL